MSVPRKRENPALKPAPWSHDMSMSKVCEHCGATFYRRRKYTVEFFEQRLRTCSKKCGSRSRRRTPFWGSLRRRFEDAYQPEPNTGCWLWLRASRPEGYGRFQVGRETAAHRVSYVLHRGPIPEGLEIDHLCRTTACVNPDHLEAVTPEENRRRAALAQRATPPR